MSKKTSPGRRRPASRDRRKHADVPFPQVREMVDDLHAVCDAVESGTPLERVATVRTHRIRREAPRPSPDEIRAIRDSLGLSQAGFAEFLGTGLATVRPGTRTAGAVRPGPTAPCRNP